MCGGSGGSGSGGRSGGGGGGSTNGDAGQPGEVVRAANKAKEAKKNKPTRYERMQGGSSTRDEGPNYRRLSNEEIAARMKKNPYRPPKADENTVYDPYR